MLLTKKGFWKIVIMTLCYFAIGSFSIAAGALLTILDADANFLFVLGAFCYAFCPIVIAWGRYAEGKGKLINLGNKLVRNELKPYEFIKEYQRLRNSTELVVNKPSIKILQLVAIAYDSLDDRNNCLCAIEEMISIANEKKKMFAKLIKCSFLFSYEMIDQAEAIFTEARASKQNFICQAFTDAIFKSNRAMAMGDYKTAEAYNLKMLSQIFPKLDNLSKLTLYYKLGEVYEKLQNYEKAIPYYKYCIDNGGATAIKESARCALQRMQ
ncbi:MAG: tetratricopeptide repeat protein [Clostridia bacterium]|nr:tetratricopeptide repeat protein [Alphaproteobacteria bacterium]MBR2313057.1 tetratricopeptide repeat protein [Clostridia bacterium]